MRSAIVNKRKTRGRLVYISGYEDKLGDFEKKRSVVFGIMPLRA